MRPEDNLDDRPFILLSGTANPALAEDVGRLLGVRPGASAVRRYPDGELSVEIGEPLRQREVFILQPTSPPVNDHLVELLALVDACRRASAAHVTAIVPYFGYARSDKRQGCRESIGARMVATLMEAVGVDHIITVDVHAPQIEGFFHAAADSVTAIPYLCDVVRPILPADAVIVSPDAGRVKTASRCARLLGDRRVVVLHKQRESGSRTHVTHVVGDVRDRTCLIVDDMISTGGTIIEAIGAVRRHGARPGVLVMATHGLLVGGAPGLLSSPDLARLYITDTIARPPPPPESDNIQVVSVAPLIAGAVRRVVDGGSLSDLC